MQAGSNGHAIAKHSQVEQFFCETVSIGKPSILERCASFLFYGHTLTVKFLFTIVPVSHKGDGIKAKSYSLHDLELKPFQIGSKSRGSPIVQMINTHVSIFGANQSLSNSSEIWDRSQQHTPGSQQFPRTFDIAIGVRQMLKCRPHSYYVNFSREGRRQKISGLNLKSYLSSDRHRGWRDVYTLGHIPEFACRLDEASHGTSDIEQSANLGSSQQKFSLSVVMLRGKEKIPQTLN